MNIRTNSNRVSLETDKHLCKFLLSDFEKSKNGLKAYKFCKNISFPETSKRSTNRLDYLKGIRKTDFVKFAQICQTYGINPSLQQNNSSDTDSSDEETEADSFSTPTKNISFSSKKNFIPEETMSFDLKKQHQERLNFDNPSLNGFGMMWFRDDDVEIGDSLVSILTVYQPLFDARDYHDINLYFDEDRPNVLEHVHPTVPKFMYQDYVQIHEQEGSKANPEVWSSTRKSHKKQAHKIRKDDDLRIRKTEYNLPFILNLDSFDGIMNSSTIEKHFRTIEVEIDEEEGITDRCNLIFWKIMIEGETIDCSTNVKSEKKKRSTFAAAVDRLKDPPGYVPPFVGDVIDEDEEMNDVHDEDEDEDDDEDEEEDDQYPSNTESALVEKSIDQNGKKKILPQLMNYIARLQHQHQQQREEADVSLPADTYDFPIGPVEQPDDPVDSDSPNKKPKLDDFKPMDTEYRTQADDDEDL